MPDSPDYDALLDELTRAVEALSGIRLDMGEPPSHNRYIAARSSLKDYVAKIEAENEAMPKELFLRHQAQIERLTRVWEETEAELSALRSSALTREEAAWAQSGWLDHNRRFDEYSKVCSCVKCEDLAAKLRLISAASPERAEK